MINGQKEIWISTNSHKAASSEFGKLFKAHFGIYAASENRKLYKKEYMHYKKYGKCRWE